MLPSDNGRKLTSGAEGARWNQLTAGQVCWADSRSVLATKRQGSIENPIRLLMHVPVPWVCYSPSGQ